MTHSQAAFSLEQSPPPRRAARPAFGRAVRLGRVRLERRPDVGWRAQLLVRLGSLIIALVLVTLLLLITGVNPVTTYQAMLSASLTTSGGLSQTLITAMPLLFTGLCAALAFQLRVYNIGGEGQLYLGAAGATLVALLLRGEPGPIIICCSLIAGGVAGALWAAIPALLRVFAHTNEILTTLMLNYVAGNLITYLIFDSASYWRDTSSAGGRVYPSGKTIPQAGFWPMIRLGSVDVPFGLLFGLLLALFCAVLLRRSTLGYRIRVAGASVAAAHYGGISLRRVALTVLLLSGAFAGLAGGAEVGNVSHLLDPNSLQQAQFGYTGIVVAAVAAFDPLGLVLSALFLGAIVGAGDSLLSTSFPVGLVGTMEGLFLFSVVSCALMLRYRFVWERRAQPAIVTFRRRRLSERGEHKRSFPESSVR